MSSIESGPGVRLRRVAEGVEAAGVPVKVQIYLGPVNEFVASQRDWVVVVEAVAATLGIVTDTELGAIGWQRRARMSEADVFVAVETRLSAPPDRCVCGAVCQHRTRSERAA